MGDAANLSDQFGAVGGERDQAVGEQFVLFHQMIGERAFHEGGVGGLLADQRAVDEMAELMAERRPDRAGMMGGVDEDYELAFLADVGAAVKSAEREAGAGAIGLGAQLEFARTEQFAEMAEQLRAAEIGQAAVCRDVLLDVLLDDLRQLLEQGLRRQRGYAEVVGRENPFQVGKLSEDSSAERAEWHLDFAEQLGNQAIDFTSGERIRFSRDSLRHRWRRGHSCTHRIATEAKGQLGWQSRCPALSDSRCFSIPICFGL